MVWLIEFVIAMFFGVRSLGVGRGLLFGVSVVVGLFVCDFLVLALQRAILMRIVGADAFHEFMGQRIVGLMLISSIGGGVVVALATWYLQPSLAGPAVACSVIDTYAKHQSNRMTHGSR